MAKAQQLKKALESEELVGEAAEGMVKVTLNGKLEMQSIEIDPSLLTPENKEKIEGAIQEAFQEASGKLQQVMIQKMQSGEI